MFKKEKVLMDSKSDYSELFQYEIDESNFGDCEDEYIESMKDESDYHAE